MSELCLLAVSLLTHKHLGEQPLPEPAIGLTTQDREGLELQNNSQSAVVTAVATTETTRPEFSQVKPSHIKSTPTPAAPQPSTPAQLPPVVLTEAVPSARISRPVQQQTPVLTTEQPRSSSPAPNNSRRLTFSDPTNPWLELPSPQPETVIPDPQRSLTIPNQVALRTPRPSSGSQLYQQRIAALRAGRNYIRLPANSFWSSWVNATEQPTYQQWTSLLSQEAGAMARGQGSNRLTILLGDSLSLWYPPEQLPDDRFWLNQGISGDTTAGVLRRLSAFDNTRPNTIHVMVGINDLRHGATDTQVLNNLRQIMRQLRQRHPQAQIFVHSILPTRLAAIPGDRISRINHSLAYIAKQESVDYLDLLGYFTDEHGNLRQDLTTDGLHLNPRGYAMWQWALRSHQLA